MKYVGSKQRISKEIIPILLKNRSGNCFVDLFMGGCNIIDKINGDRIANDINPYLVSCAEALSNGWLPPKDIDEKMYLDVKNNMNLYDKALIGYMGFQLSYGAKWFDSYRRDNYGKRNYSHEAYNNVAKQAVKLKNVKFYNLDYREVPMPPNSIIYCDPPYKNTTKYGANKEDFDHDIFWQWCRDKSRNGYQVYISEYNAPSDFECIWQKDILKNLADHKSREIATEKVFVFNSGSKMKL